ncbi:Gibberellin 20-oxidase protein [Thalictrum thalictroides]|uniref:Gibberellin 20-oxidase protein n=1 Tax=Thalictrum thalictroides TaxID=46969 RepID=A0A7J6XHG5_THATH|nr:Gibberellin 20-oxidase protein [Thalictrum thalictroides]
MDLKYLQRNPGMMSFDSSLMQKQTSIPREFIWPQRDLVHSVRALKEPLVDLQGVLRGEDREILKAAQLIREACLKHGFFQVTNHGVDARLISAAHEHMDAFFKLPISEKLKVSKKPGSLSGYSNAHATRFSSQLPWKETLSFGYHENDSNPVVLDYFKSALGKEFEQAGLIYQKYCKAMKELSLVIMELLAISLGVDRLHFRKFFEDSNSIARCNYYPPCQEPSLTFGTGPHTDPTSLTILHQDQVGGLEVFTQNKWQAVEPRPDALVINIGDTFMVGTCLL